jgi:hypothetical protein
MGNKSFRIVWVDTFQSTKYQYTILDLLQERIIFLHLKQFLTWSLVNLNTTLTKKGEVVQVYKLPAETKT